MHSLINVLVNFNEFINKHINLQNITLDKLLTNVIPIAPISKNFQYNHYILEPNTSNNFTINRYKLPLAPTFCFTNFKVQKQTFDHLIIDICQPLDNVQLNMHNIYIMLSCLHSIDGLIILQVSLYKT
jgi:hypothetical protein